MTSTIPNMRYVDSRACVGPVATTVSSHRMPEPRAVAIAVRPTSFQHAVA